MQANHYDCVIIGAGPAGIAAANRARALGKTVCVVEQKDIGGTCLNKGCIPTKLLLKHAREHEAATHQVTESNSLVSPAEIYERFKKANTQLLSDMRAAAQRSLLSAGVAFIQGKCLSIDNGSCLVQNTDTETADKSSSLTLTWDKAVIATGSSPCPLKGLDFGQGILSSDDLFNLPKLPQSIIIVGAGAVGCEWADIFSALNIQVHLVEDADYILPAEDADISRRIQSSFQKRNIKVSTSTTVLSCIRTNGLLRASLSDGTESDAEILLIAAGRKPQYPHCSKFNDSIVLCGDAAGKLLLAVSAELEGRQAADTLFTQNRPHIDYDTIPVCLYSQPEYARVGPTEKEAHKRGLSFETLRLPLQRASTARIRNDAGAAKLLIEPSSKTLIGAQILGGPATELISLLTLALREKVPVSRLGTLPFPHPSYSEVFSLDYL